MPFDLLAIFDPTQIEAWMEAGGYIALFAILFGCGLGLPVPEDIPLIISGYLIANGKMDWAAAGFVAWSGIIGGDLALYHIARRYGHNITRVPFVGKHINAARLDQLERYFEKYGVWVVAIGRLFAGVRGAMVVAAGTIRYNRVKFFLADGIAALVSGGLFVWLGHFLGRKIPLNQLIERIDQWKWWIVVGLIVLTVLGGIWWSVKRRRAAGIPTAPEH